ncbi:MAG: thioesterase family protein [Pseudomonadota bacterium]
MSGAAGWPVAAPFVVERVAGPDDIDAFDHVNNLVYPAWALDAAWAHSAALGVTMATYRDLGAGFVVQRHDFTYAAPVLLGERVQVATWIADTDARVRLRRAYAFRKADGAICFRGETLFVCVDMRTGKPTRMPPPLRDAYRAAAPI